MQRPRCDLAFAGRPRALRELVPVPLPRPAPDYAWTMTPCPESWTRLAGAELKKHWGAMLKVLSAKWRAEEVVVDGSLSP